MRVRATRLRRLRIRKAVGHATLGLFVLAAGLAYLALEKDVTLVVEGQPHAVRTMSSNVGQLLAVQGISLDPGVRVDPPPATVLSDGMTVFVDLGEVPAATPDGVGVWVVEGVGGPFAKAAVQATEDGFSADPSVGQSRIVSARVVVKGKEHDVLTNATTVRELLSAMRITPDVDDRVLPPPSTPLQSDLLVRFLKVRYRMRRVQVPVPFATLTEYSTNLSPGVVRIERPGTPGMVLRTFRVRLVDGKAVWRELIRERTLSAPVPERRTVGRTPSGTETGEASWYYAPGTGLTAAHPWLPFGTRVTVTNLANGRSVTVVINDRGPFGGRIIDLSPEAFSAIAPLGAGVCQVRLTW